METNSSGEDLLKVRKPYTITKQRERWTEDEHNRFLQALKLYGRAWQKIEEHVGTKTAVQIRSHAQKFFTKMEKEGVNNKGGKEIEIPPPRPKRKPTCPYPKKGKGVSVNFHPLTVDFSKPKHSSPSSNRETPCMEIDATQEKNIGSDENGSCSETLTLFHEAPCVSSISSLKLEPIDKITNPLKPDPNPKPVNTKQAGPSEAQQPNFQIPSPYLPNYPPFPPYLPNKPFVETFSNLLITNLVQNPAVHAAARLAASYWTPPVEAEMESSSLAALAAATVAAASSWWASQGLLPFYPQLSPFQFNDGLVGNNNNNDNSSSGINMGENNEKNDGPVVQNDSDENMKINAVSNEVNEINNNNNNKKKQDPSSCGSNTPSTSDVETDNIPENQQKGPICDNEKTEGAFGNNNNDNNIINSDSLRRGRSNYITSFNESWKEVSEEGRLAFQALFKRGVLPQSFSPPKNHKFNNAEERESAVAELEVDLNTCADVINPFASIQGMDLYGKLKGRKTGFKPYKRCSIEASENRATAGEESPAGNKRIRLEGETSI